MRAWLALLLPLVWTFTPAGPAGAIAFQVEGWSAQWSGGGFSDDFEDGLLDPALFAFCGGLQPGDETGGALVLRRPDFASCGGQQGVAWSQSATGALTLDAVYRFAAPSVIGEAYGVAVGDGGGSDFVSLAASTFANAGQEQLILTLSDEHLAGTNFVEFLVLPGPASALGFASLELQIVLTAIGGELVPHGRVAFDGGPFQDLGANVDPGVPADGGALDAGASHFANLFAIAVVPEPGAAALLAGALAAGAATALRHRAGRGR